MIENNINNVCPQADIGVFTVQQKEKNTQIVYDSADVIVENIKEVLNIDF